MARLSGSRVRSRHAFPSRTRTARRGDHEYSLRADQASKVSKELHVSAPIPPAQPSDLAQPLFLVIVLSSLATYLPTLKCELIFLILLIIYLACCVLVLTVTPVSLLAPRFDPFLLYPAKWLIRITIQI
jgi:hypothetical protein